MIRVPGGAKGVLLKSKCPFNWANPDMRGLIPDFRRRLSVIVACGKTLSHSFRGKVGYTEQIPAIK
jgi:hypothetical protein